MTHSLENPALEPPERVLMIVADYGPDGGGWGPAAWLNPATGQFGPFVYTNDATHVLAAAHELARSIAAAGREARVVRFTGREDLGTYEP